MTNGVVVLFRGSLVSLARRAAVVAVGAAGLAPAGGCQGGPPIQHRRLIEHQALVDFSGLKPAEPIPDLKASAAVPSSWARLTPPKSALYTAVQWRSPSSNTGVGAAYVRLPLPLGVDAVLWFAKREYTKRASDGKLLAEWTDDLGRKWFEAENDKYHVRGYALAQGFEAWIVAFGYKRTAPPDFTEISLAARAADTFVPAVGAAAPRPTTGPSTQPVAAAGR